jgi:hypothetical protein
MDRGEEFIAAWIALGCPSTKQDVDRIAHEWTTVRPRPCRERAS